MPLSPNEIIQWRTLIDNADFKALRSNIEQLPDDQMSSSNRFAMLQIPKKAPLKRALTNWLNTVTSNETSDRFVNGVCISLLVLHSPFYACFRHCEGLWTREELTTDEIGDLKTSVQISNGLQIFIFFIALFVLWNEKRVFPPLRYLLYSIICPFHFMYMYGFDEPLPVYKENMYICLDVYYLCILSLLYALRRVVWFACTLYCPTLLT